jgi:hypothetical protein
MPTHQIMTNQSVRTSEASRTAAEHRKSKRLWCGSPQDDAEELDLAEKWRTESELEGQDAIPLAALKCGGQGRS